MPEILRLRYGTDLPNLDDTALFSRSTVSRYLNIDIRAITSIEQFFFRSSQRPNQQLNDIEYNQIYQLTSSENLNECCTLSLSERAKLFRMEDPNINFSANKLRSIYKKCNIRKKRIIKVAANPRKYTPDVLEEMLNDLKFQLVNLDEAGYEIFQLDESIFNGQDHIKTAWSRPNEHIKFTQISKHLKFYTVMASISSKQGKILSVIKDKYFKQDDMLDFLKILKRQNCGIKIAIFLDNCSVHKTNKVKQFAFDNKIEMVYNIPYCPWFNGIEKIWAVMKQRFRSQLTIVKQKRIQFNLLELIKKVELDLEMQTIIDCASNGWCTIFKDNLSQNLNFQSIELK